MKIAVIGAGLMGRAVVYDLAQRDDVEKVGVFDVNENLALQIGDQYGCGKALTGHLDAGDEDQAATLLEQYDAAISCVPFSHNLGLTRSAIRAGCHLMDLGGNNDVVRQQLELNPQAEEAGVIIVPDCGLAPGMVALLAVDGISKMDKVCSLKIRVGGLPQVPRPPLNYQMVFSAEGLINEYWEPCLILEDGKKKTVNPLTGLELLEFDGVGKLEAFYTSGGASTMPDTFKDKVDNLDYKTIRYPGHCQLIKPMLEIGLGSRKKIEIDGHMVEPRAVFKAVLEKNLSHGDLDMILVRVIVEGEKNGADKTLVYEIIDRQDTRTGLTAMMRTTAFPAAIIGWLAASGQIKERGVKPQESAVEPSLFFPELKKRNIKLVVRQ